jgi:hypothetical protein
MEATRSCTLIQTMPVILLSQQLTSLQFLIFWALYIVDGQCRKSQ